MNIFVIRGVSASVQEQSRASTRCELVNEVKFALMCLCAASVCARARARERCTLSSFHREVYHHLSSTNTNNNEPDYLTSELSE